MPPNPGDASDNDPAHSNGAGGFDWYEAGRSLATRLLASRMSPFQLSDLRFRYGILLRHHGQQLAALGAPHGLEAQTPGQWVTHVDGRTLYLTAARGVAENAFNLGWDHVVEPVLRERTRTQHRADAPPKTSPAHPACLVTLDLPRVGLDGSVNLP